ncbi:MAG: gliding motility-associated C-terminal domain-containing protein, partial [Bacteroidales bacterium]
SESKLEVPNAFSPGNDGINDIFKVAYQSIVRFRGNIFNRWGVKLFQWEDPSEGWDGEYNGKLVNTGVYFYLIEAEGSDGKKYKLKGDINLFREK